MEMSAFPWLETETASAETVSLKNVFLHATKACNLRCAYCYFSASQPLPDEMTTAEFDRLWPEMVTLRPEKVVFTGGEPLLRTDILELLGGLRAADPEHHVLRCLNTNGHLVTPELARALVGLADEAPVSVDALAACNDALRGAVNFEQAMRALECFYSVGFESKALTHDHGDEFAGFGRTAAACLSSGRSRASASMAFVPSGAARGIGSGGRTRKMCARLCGKLRSVVTRTGLRRRSRRNPKRNRTAASARFSTLCRTAMSSRATC
jgi:hypothetical protein